MEFTGKITDITPIQLIANKYEKKQLIITSQDGQVFVSDIFGSKALDEFESYHVNVWDMVTVHFTFSGKNSKGNRYGWVTIEHIDSADDTIGWLFAGDDDDALPF